jgi:1,2-diacylglycerol-3-alpha-glucose alpha-1,2-glucosyltransferase
MDKLKVLVYFEDSDDIKTSGIGRALLHQQIALKNAGVEFTTDVKDDYNLVHINTYYFDSQKLLKKCKKRNIPVIVHGHSTIEDFRNSFRIWKFAAKFFNKWLMFMYTNADYIIAPTKYAENLIKSYEGVNCPSTHISNGIDLDRYKPNEEAKRKFKEQFDIKDGDKVVMGVGFPFERKGIFDFLEIAEQMPDVKFIWFGYLQRIFTPIKNIKAMENKPDNVLFPGYISSDIIIGAYQTVDLLLFPSYEETEGIVVLEALASRTPLLVRDIGVYEGWLKDGENAVFANNNVEFVEKIRYMLSHDMTELTNNGYETAKERSLEKVGEQLKETYMKVMELHNAKKEI